jgi:hypothetical protein
VTSRLRSDDLEWREVGGEIVILDLKSSNYLALNDTGALLWKLLAGGASEEELRNALTAEFDVDEATSVGDVAEFLTALRSKGLLDEDVAP